LLFAKVCTGLEIDSLFSLCVPLLRFVGGVAYAKKGLIGLWFVWLTNIIWMQKECSCESFHSSIVAVLGYLDWKLWCIFWMRWMIASTFFSFLSVVRFFNELDKFLTQIPETIAFLLHFIFFAYVWLYRKEAQN
jgi:hypothetical protein